MATIKTVEYLCPHCGKKVPSLPRGKCVSMELKRGTFGQAVVNCKKCKKPYIQPFVKEAGLFLTVSERVPLLLCSTRLLLVLIICACFAVSAAIVAEEILAALILAAISALGIFLVMFVFGALTRSFRQNRKDAVLAASRERLLNDDAYLLHLLHISNIAATKAYLRDCFAADQIPFQGVS